jgi:membrane-bound serine protease (ClpP class)
LEFAILLFAVGVVLVVMELFIPSFGMLALSATVCFSFSVWQAYKASGLGAACAMGIIAPIVSATALYVGLKVMPRTRWGRGLVLSNPAAEGAEERPTVSETAYLPPQGGTDEAILAPLVGKEGAAQSSLRPVGVALLDGQRVDVVTEGGMIDAGARIKVVAVEGNRVVVRKVRV